MKSLWKTILNGLTYTDLAGRRQLRSYTAMALAIWILLSLTASFIFFKKAQVMGMVKAAPVPVQVTVQVAAQPTSTPVAETYEPGCPTDPAKWDLAEPIIPQNYKVIQPACVYEGLEKTIAWALAVHEGYSRAEATQILGFREMPMRQLDQVKITTESGLRDMPVSFIPADPDLTEWRLDNNGDAAVTYALRGCFRTSTIVGNRVEVWGGDYSVICLVVEDAENSHIVYSLHEHTYTASATPMRSFLLFGYLNKESWIWLGTQSDPKQEIVDPDVNANDRLTLAKLYDSHPWDAKWLNQTYHLEMHAPPENWQTLNDEAEKQVILTVLSRDLNGVAP